jgi:metal-responsive CopG/Arc/MetJ family transcriptional regulator
MASPATKQIVAARIPRSVVDEVRRIADRESESTSTIIRRLLRSGLDMERRSATPEEVSR